MFRDTSAYFISGTFKCFARSAGDAFQKSKADFSDTEALKAADRRFLALMPWLMPDHCDEEPQQSAHAKVVSPQVSAEYSCHTC